MNNNNKKIPEYFRLIKKKTELVLGRSGHGHANSPVRSHSQKDLPLDWLWDPDQSFLMKLNWLRE